MLEKLTYSIGHVSELVGVSPSTLRYWETVIESLNPQKTVGGSRRYTAEDIERVRQLKVLLHEQGMTIKGVNKLLKNNPQPDLVKAFDPRIDAAVDRDILEEILRQLIEIKNTLQYSKK